MSMLALFFVPSGNRARHESDGVTPHPGGVIAGIIGAALRTIGNHSCSKGELRNT